MSKIIFFKYAPLLPCKFEIKIELVYRERKNTNCIMG